MELAFLVKKVLKPSPTPPLDRFIFCLIISLSAPCPLPPVNSWAFPVNKKQ
jgi:hypothetical protein